MASAWAKSWGFSWGNSWGEAVTPPVVYMRPPDIPDDEPPRMTTMEIAMLWVGASQAGIARRSVLSSAAP